jgi:hypothetical protein
MIFCTDLVRLWLAWLLLSAAAPTMMNVHATHNQTWGPVLGRWGPEDLPPQMLIRWAGKQPKQSRKISKTSKFLVLGVISAPPNFAWRAAIRSTWFQLALRVPVSTVLRFVIGWRENQWLEERIDAELAAHGDIIRVPVADTYTNLIYKVLHFFDWADTNYSFRYLMRVNDNTFLTLDRLLVSAFSIPFLLCQ